MLVDRRLLIGGLFMVATGCAQEGSVTQRRSASKARLQARPKTGTKGIKAGLQPLPVTGGREALLYVPVQRDANGPMPLVVSLHGAGGNAHHGIDLLKGQADALGVAVLAPKSHRQTWDVIVDDFGPDSAFVDKALETAFETCEIDPARIAIGGFSDGASYALTLGLANGDLFQHILAFSPGFSAHPLTTGKPRVFVSHGTRDQVLPIERCSRRLVPQLKAAGYQVDYREFEGPHTVPTEMAAAAMTQLVRATSIERG